MEILVRKECQGKLEPREKEQEQEIDYADGTHCL
jgi:hypothetical protein